MKVAGGLGLLPVFVISTVFTFIPSIFGDVFPGQLSVVVIRVVLALNNTSNKVSLDIDAPVFMKKKEGGEVVGLGSVSSF